MCNYKYEYKRHHLTGLSCIYPAFYEQYSVEFPELGILPLDSEGFCLFHSKDRNWKIRNSFDEKFYQLLKVTEHLCNIKRAPKWTYNFSGFCFVTEKGPFMLKDCPNHSSIEFTFCDFVNGLSLENSKINSIDISNATFNDHLRITNLKFNSGINATGTKFNNGVVISDSFLEGHNYFEGCNFKRARFTEFGCRFNNITSEYLSFENSTFDTGADFKKVIFKGEVIFNKVTFLDEFYFHDCQVDTVISFKETSFQLSENANPRYSSVDFNKLTINQKGKIIFRGSEPFENMIQGELNMNFNSDPEGLVSFENFNLNKIATHPKLKLFELEKLGKVEIGVGCRKYYCQTDIFTITTSSPNQTLILDLVKVFCNYFEIKNHYNLGVEIIERGQNIIRYFFFTDELITRDEFEKRIKNNEYDLWRTFSNLSGYAGEEFPVMYVEEKNKLIDLAAIFLKIRNRILFMNDYNQEDLNQLASSIAVDGKSAVKKSISVDGIVNSNQSFYQQLPSIEPDRSVYYDNSITVTGSRNIIASGNQGSIISHDEIAKEDPESKELAKQSIKWTKKQTNWTIIGVVVATLLSIIGLRLAGYI